MCFPGLKPGLIIFTFFLSGRLGWDRAPGKGRHQGTGNRLRVDEVSSLESRQSEHRHTRAAEPMPFLLAALFFIFVAFHIIHQVALKSILLA